MRYCDLTILVTALFLIRDLVFNLNRTGTGFNHFLRQ